MKKLFKQERYLELADEALRDKDRKPIEDIFRRAMGREMRKAERKVFHLKPKKRLSKVKP